jgi:raffinose/stachyose/melibiose transport system permease protein
MRFRGANILFYVLLLGMMIPVEGFVVPLYFDLRGYNLTSTYFALALPQIAQSLGFSTYWIRNTFRAYPQSIVEAARIDGAGDSRILWGVLVPSSRPALLTMVLLLFMWAWNEFLLALIMVAGSSASTAPIGLTLFKGQYTTSYNLTAAAGVLVALPIVILFVFLQRHFINGMVSGALRE